MTIFILVIDNSSYSYLAIMGPECYKLMYLHDQLVFPELFTTTQ